MKHTRYQYLHLTDPNLVSQRSSHSRSGGGVGGGSGSTGSLGSHAMRAKGGGATTGHAKGGYKAGLSAGKGEPHSSGLG